MSETPFHPNFLMSFEDLLGTAASPYSSEDLQGISYRPTLVIGLGGTGCDVVRKLKRRIEAHFDKEHSRIFQYLVIDTAPEKITAGQQPLGSTIFLHLKNFPAAQMIANLKEREPLRQWWMYPHVPTYTGNGAGAIRAVARLVLHRYASALIKPRLYDKVRAAVDIAGQHGMNQRGFKVYIVCSVAGGTGSGMMLDMAYMVRDQVASLFPGKCAVTGVLVMPSAFISRARAPVERQRWQANGYASLAELDMFNARRNYQQDFGGGYKVGALVKGERPFDITYLVSLFNENGQALSNYDSLTEMIAEEMMLEIASPMQNDVTNALDNIQETNQIRDGHPFAYSTFVVASLLYPLERVASWLGLKFMPVFINDVLLRPLRLSEQAQQDAQALVDELQLREEGADQLIKALNLDSMGNEASPAGLEYASFEGLLETDLLDAQQRETQSALQRLSASLQVVQTCQLELARQRPDQVRRRVNELLGDPESGPLFADWFLTSLEALLKAYRNEQMLAEQAQWQSRLDEAQAALPGALEDVEKALRLPGIVPWRRSQITQAVNRWVGLFNVRLEAEHQAALRAAAVLVYGALLEITAALLYQVRELTAAFRRVAQEAEQAAEQERVHLKVTRSDFSLVKSIVDEAMLLETYEQARPPIGSKDQKRQLASGFWKFLKLRLPQWALGSTSFTLRHVASQAFYYLGQDFGSRLAAISLLDRLKSRREAEGEPNQYAWGDEVTERYEQAAPFWNISLVTSVADVERNLRRSPNLMGYGESDLQTHWAEEVNAHLPEEVTPVQTRSNQELIFLKTVHALPLFAVYEAETELRSAYELLQQEWKDGKSDLPVHVSRTWEAEIVRHEREKQNGGRGKPPRAGDANGRSGAGGERNGKVSGRRSGASPRTTSEAAQPAVPEQS